jgi:hypothetical protein
MNALPVSDDFPLVETVERLIERHGPRRLLMAVLGRLVRRRTERPARFPGHLSDHMRRDIGMPPEAYHRRHWDLY